jgi:hypothetical protein
MRPHGSAVLGEAYKFVAIRIQRSLRQYGFAMVSDWFGVQISRI